MLYSLKSKTKQFKVGSLGDTWQIASKLPSTTKAGKRDTSMSMHWGRTGNRKKQEAERWVVNPQVLE